MQAPRARAVDRQSGGHALGEPRRPPARRSRSSALREVSRMGAEAPHGEAGRPRPRQPRQLPRLRPALGQRALPRIPRRAHRAAQPERPSPPLLLAQLRPLAHRLVVDPDSRLLRGGVRRPGRAARRGEESGRRLGGVANLLLDGRLGEERVHGRRHPLAQLCVAAVVDAAALPPARLDVPARGGASAAQSAEAVGATERIHTASAAREERVARPALAGRRAGC